VRKVDIFGKPLTAPIKCKNCGRERGKHLAGILACPLTTKQFTYFSKDKFYEPKEKR
jgi:hypothetical protein